MVAEVGKEFPHLLWNLATTVAQANQSSAWGGMMSQPPPPFFYFGGMKIIFAVL
jgi:hypothetical protein